MICDPKFLLYFVFSVILITSTSNSDSLRISKVIDLPEMVYDVAVLDETLFFTNGSVVCMNLISRVAAKNDTIYNDFDAREFTVNTIDKSIYWLSENGIIQYDYKKKQTRKILKLGQIHYFLSFVKPFLYVDVINQVTSIMRLNVMKGLKPEKMISFSGISPVLDVEATDDLIVYMRNGFISKFCLNEKKEEQFIQIRSEQAWEFDNLTNRCFISEPEDSTIIILNLENGQKKKESHYPGISDFTLFNKDVLWINGNTNKLFSSGQKEVVYNGNNLCIIKAFCKYIVLVDRNKNDGCRIIIFK